MVAVTLQEITREEIRAALAMTTKTERPCHCCEVPTLMKQNQIFCSDVCRFRYHNAMAKKAKMEKTQEKVTRPLVVLNEMPSSVVSPALRETMFKVFAKEAADEAKKKAKEKAK